MCNELLNQMDGKICWRVGKYLGSMLYFDFGEKILVPNKLRGTNVEQGEAIFGVRNCYWTLRSGGHLVADSDSIDDESAVKSLPCIQGKQIVDLLASTLGFINVVFSDGVVLSLDSTNRYGTDGPIAEFVMPDGRIFNVTPRGHFYLLDQISSVRFAKRVEKLPG
jgi:hypothetical protein